MKEILYYCLICLTGVSIIISQSSCEKKSESRIAMPQGLENVYIGMSFKELKSIKPHIQEDSPLFTKTYFDEDSGNSYFPGNYPSSVKYEFANGELASISLSYRSEDHDYIRSKLPGLIKGAIKLWGVDFERKVGFTENPINPDEIYKYPLYRWIKTDVEIVLRPVYVYFRSKEILNSEIYIFLKKHSPKNIKTKLDATSGTKEFEEVFSVIPDIANYNGPVFE